ncbi:HNH endonuclease [Alphaproteobacteria bacterium]|nr:HNH endonuclease [Alphaproteobacteria bacterium]
MWKNYHYKKRHDWLINKYGTVKKPIDVYTEGHHIIPKSLGGVDSSSNIIFLPARVHLLVHWCLAKGTEHPKMIGAFGWMSQRVHKTNFQVSARTYEAAQKAQSKAASIRSKERTIGKISLNQKHSDKLIIMVLILYNKNWSKQELIDFLISKSLSQKQAKSIMTHLKEEVERRIRRKEFLFLFKKSFNYWENKISTKEITKGIYRNSRNKLMEILHSHEH